MPSLSSSKSNSNNKKRSMAQTSLFTAFGHKKSKQEQDNHNVVEKKFQIFCDLDGVLVDFNKGVEKLTGGKRPNQLSSSVLWSSIHRNPNFYIELDWCSDGEELWNAIRPLKPHILTGISHGSTVATQKFQWCKRELCVEVQHVHMAGPKKTHVTTNTTTTTTATPSITKRNPNVTQVITCWSKNKHCESRPNHVLIDDREELGKQWESKGGIFIHHVNTRQTLEMLKKRGILNDAANVDR